MITRAVLLSILLSVTAGFIIYGSVKSIDNITSTYKKIK
jgi:hypothetical protein